MKSFFITETAAVLRKNLVEMLNSDVSRNFNLLYKNFSKILKTESKKIGL